MQPLPVPVDNALDRALAFALVTTPQDPQNRSQQQPYVPAPPPLSESELTGSGGYGRPAVAEPKEVRLSFFLWLATSLLLVVSAVLIFTDRDVALEEARRTQAEGVTPEQLEAAVNVVLVTFVVIGVLLAALLAFFAFKVRAGRNWARITLTVLGVIVLIFNLLSFTWLGVLIVLAAAGAIVAMYLPASKAYFDSAKRVG